MTDERDAQIIAEPLDSTELEEALSADRDDRSAEEWDLIEWAAEKWLSGHDSDLERAAADLWRSDNPQQSVFDCDEETKALYRRRLALERSTGDVQTQAERPPSMRDNFSDDEIAAAFRDQRTLDRVLDALDIANTDQDPDELIVQMVSHIENLRSAKATPAPDAATGGESLPMTKDELIWRCVNAINPLPKVNVLGVQSIDVPGIVRAVLRASKHAEIVEALEAVEPVHDSEGNLTLETVGMSVAAWTEKRDAALGPESKAEWAG